MADGFSIQYGFIVFVNKVFVFVDLLGIAYRNSH